LLARDHGSRSLGSRAGRVKRGLLRWSRRVTRMLRFAVCVAEIKVAQINRQWHRRAEHAHGVALIDRKIAEHQQAPERAAFPEAEGDHTFPGAFRCDPLNEETQAEHEAAA